VPYSRLVRRSAGRALIKQDTERKRDREHKHEMERKRDREHKHEMERKRDREHKQDREHNQDEPVLMKTTMSGRKRLIAVPLAVLLPILLSVGLLAAACGSDGDGTGPVRPVRLPPTTISEGEPPPRIPEPPRPVDPLPPPEVEQP
jgi:hypothetical protein